MSSEQGRRICGRMKCAEYEKGALYEELIYR
jgi:hypothetical protein